MLEYFKKVSSKEALSKLALVVLSLLFLSYNMASAKQIEVCEACPVHSVKSAISASLSGDSIIVKGGHYFEVEITVDKPLTLIGIDNPILDGKDKKKGILLITADSVTVQGFTFQNVGVSYLEDLSGLRVRRSKHFLIQNNTILNCMFAISLERAKDGKVIGNKVFGEAKDETSSGNGIHAWYCKRLEIRDNEVRNQRDGIYFEFVDNSFVINNRNIDNLRYGLHFMFSNEDEYRDNLFERNGAGVAVMFSKKINMYNNHFINNWGGASYGLLLKEIYDAEIEGNTFDKNTLGIKVDGSSRINYVRNTFSNNGWAIRFSGGCYDNQVKSNNFISNSFDIAVESATNDNGFAGNYWSEYAGYDLDHDGEGDVPFRPVKLFNYIVSQTPETIVLLRSLFIDIINFSEKVSPVFTPENVMDHSPQMRKIVF